MNSEKIKDIIKDAEEKLEIELKEGKTTSFEIKGQSVLIPTAIINLVHTLNPKDDKKREAITNELFRDKKNAKM